MRRVALVSLPVLLLIASGCGTTVRATEQITLNQPWANYTRVEVAVKNGGVELRAGDVDQIRISGRKCAGGLTLAEAEQNLDQLTVYAGASDAQPDTFLVELRYPEELRNKNVGADLVIEIPEPCAAKIATSNGSIRVEHMAGEVVLESSNGSLHALHVDGTVRAGTSNGGIEIQHVSGGVTAKSSNGGVTAQEVGGPCVLRTSNGDVRCVLAPTAQGDIELRSSNGRIHATLPASLAAELKLSTSNGRVRVALGEAAVKMVDTSRTRFHGVMNGGGDTVIAETSNGSITVEAR
jgi:hypothetical protein